MCFSFMNFVYQEKIESVDNRMYHNWNDWKQIIEKHMYQMFRPPISLYNFGQYREYLVSS